jgi:large repetitive protein
VSTTEFHARGLATTLVAAPTTRGTTPMRKPTALLTSLLTALALAAGLTVASPAPSPAAALSPGVQFSADNLPTWQTNGVVYALATAASGRVVVGGTFSQLRPPSGGTGTAVNRSALAVLNAETGAPESCALNVAYTNGTPTVRSLVRAPDGNTVYVGGNFTSINGVNVTRVAAINPVTCTVTSFRAPSVSSTVYAMALSGSRLYLGGAFTSVGGQARQKFAAVSTTTNSTLLPWVANAGLVDRATTATADGRALTVSPDRSKVVVGGEFDSINGQDSHSIAVVDATTGANVRNYPAPFIHRNSVTKGLHSDGVRFYAANEGTGTGVFDGRFAVNWGTLNEEWRDNCLGATQAVLEHNGTLYAASHAHDCTSVGAFQDGKRNFFTAQKAASPATLLQWFPRANDGIGEGIGPRALTIAKGRTTGKEYLWSGGEFTQINGAAQQGLTRWGPDDTGNPPGTTPTAEALTNGAIQVRFRTVTDTDDSDLRYSVFRNGSTTPIYTTTATSFWWTRPQVTFVDTNVTPGTRYTYRVQVTDGRNTSGLSSAAAATATSSGSAYASRIIGDGARLYWRYDETSGEWVQDKSARSTTTTANNGLYKFGARGGAAGAISGDGSTAATFDGVDDFVWEDRWKLAPTTYTMETWFRTDTTTGGKLIGFGSGRPRTDSGAASPSRAFDRHLYMENSGRLTFGVYTGEKVTLRSAAAYNDNRWHHVVATQSPAGMRLYVDGVSVGSNSVPNAQNYAGVWHVGWDNLNGWPNQPTSSYFRGQIDETAIYDTALSASQVADHHALAGAGPTVVTRGLSADALVAENNAAKTYGTASFLVTRGGTGARNYSYLAFDVPSAPSGKTLTGVTLRIRTSPDSASASGDSFDLRLRTGSWNETTVNWTTRPTGTGPTIGRLTGARALHTFYEVPLDAAALRDLAGTRATVVMLGSGTDNLRFSSREATAANRPVLTFTYTS